jgi:hypothetical protein
VRLCKSVGVTYPTEIYDECVPLGLYVTPDPETSKLWVAGSNPAGVAIISMT